MFREDKAVETGHSKCSTLLDLEVQVFHFYVGFVCLLLLNVRTSVVKQIHIEFFEVQEVGEDLTVSKPVAGI